MTPTTAELLDERTPHQLTDEIRQIAEQYGREVSTARRTWPKSVKDRVLALARLGVPRNRIGRECGIPPATVFLWCEKLTGRKARVGLTKTAPIRPALSPTHFLELGGSDHATPTPTVGLGMEMDIPPMRSESGMGLQILLPGGVEVRGLSSIDQVLALYRGSRS